MARSGRAAALVVAVAVALTACGDSDPSHIVATNVPRFVLCTDVSGDDIRQDYTVLWDDDDDVGFARAEFRHLSGTGSFVELDGGCSVTFNGTAMAVNEESPTAGSVLYYDVPLRVPELSGTFVFTDGSGDTYTNSITVTEFKWTPPIRLDLSGMSVSYRPGLASSEEVTFRARATDDGTGQLSFSGTENPLVVPLAEFAGWTGDEANVWMVRKTKGTLQEQTANERGEIDYEWRTAVERRLPVLGP